MTIKIISASEPLELRDLLQQVVTKTTLSKPTTISISSINAEFSINFPIVIPANETVLAQLRVYYSWPNIRSQQCGGLQPYNSLIFANKDKPDETLNWQLVSIPTGSYQIDKINEEFHHRKVAITVYEPPYHQ